jgi:hypothetical protein
MKVAEPESFSLEKNASANNNDNNNNEDNNDNDDDYDKSHSNGRSRCCGTIASKLLSKVTIIELHKTIKVLRQQSTGRR